MLARLDSGGIATIGFTAADGREVDLTKLRGKIVLIDFWATWCTPCKEELPGILAAYRKYHDKGFEAVGITLENAVMSKDAPEAKRTAFLEKIRRDMLDYAKSQGLPWPQYFDGQWWQNPYYKKFIVSGGIPVTILLDRGGKAVATNLRGPALEMEIEKLLGS